MEKELFKKCNCCGSTWRSIDDFLSDPAIKLIGYQANFVELELGLFLFNHSCGSTMSIEVQTFSHLYDGPFFKKRMTGSPTCQGLCIKRHELGRCPTECECAYVREVMQIIQAWPKKSHVHASG
ncbi:MAG: hypothetical protein A2X49_06245 [Lentisphaerae bacterium GWF2_52_8]|nr:MAG: hypothetical protein A2X49_06245 [Lentisphaerae bacterium GWF2_52_8]